MLCCILVVRKNPFFSISFEIFVSCDFLVCSVVLVSSAHHLVYFFEFYGFFIILKVCYVGDCFAVIKSDLFILFMYAPTSTSDRDMLVGAYG